MNTTTSTRSGTETDLVTPRSTRYRLSHAELGASLQVAGLVPDGTLLEPVRSVDDPTSVLRPGQLVDANGSLHPFLAASLSVAARPCRTLRVLATAPGASDWIDILVGAAAGGGPYVTVGPPAPNGTNPDAPGERSAEFVELRAIDTSLELAAVLDDVFRLGGFPTRPVDPDIMLTLPAWVGLLAVADVRRLRRLRSELRRQPVVDEPISVTDLAGAITVGLAGTDARWAVSVAVPVAPVDLRKRTPNAADVVEDLLTLDLARRSGEHIVATELGNDLIEVMAQPMLVGTATLTHHRDGRSVRGGELLVYRGTTRLLMGLWTGTHEAPLLDLMEPTPEAAVAMVRRFAELAAPATPSSPPPPPPFDASHRVGEQGARVWPRPDPAADPIGTLAQGTAVAVLNTRGAWAHVSTDADGEGWVDGRQLVEL